MTEEMMALRGLTEKSADADILREMIETYYAAHIKHMIDAAAINVRKARKPAKADDRTRRPALRSSVKTSTGKV